MTVYFTHDVMSMLRDLSDSHFDSVMDIMRRDSSIQSGGSLSKALIPVAAGIGCRVSNWSSQPMDEQFSHQEQASNRWLIIVNWKEERVQFKDRLVVTQTVDGVSLVRHFDVMVIFKQQSYRVNTQILCYEVLIDV